MKSLLVLAAILMLSSCSNAPTTAPPHLYPTPQNASDGDGVVVRSDGTVIHGTWGTIVTTKDGVQMTTKVLYTKDGTYICDYPLGYAGPPSPGHCYTDGSGCSG